MSVRKVKCSACILLKIRWLYTIHAIEMRPPAVCDKVKISWSFPRGEGHSVRSLASAALGSERRRRGNSSLRLDDRVFRTALVLLAASAIPFVASAQENAGAPTEEIVVNLSAGRVVIAVVKDAILIGTVENPIEPQTHVPTPVELSSERAGVILGAVDWFSPSAQKTLARLDRELPHLHSELSIGQAPPHLAESQGGDEAADIEAIGQNLLERLNELAGGIHGKLDMPAKEPLAQLIVADYLANYGAEVWQASYTMKQTQQRGDFWATSVLRPVYLQFYPPEKGQPRTLMEFSYPADASPPALLSLLQSGDPRLAKIKASDPKMAEVAATIPGRRKQQSASCRRDSISARCARRYCAAKFAANNAGNPA